MRHILTTLLLLLLATACHREQDLGRTADGGPLPADGATGDVDRDAGSTDGISSDGGDEGGECTVCETPPDTRCVDAETLRRFDGTGECVEGTCEYGWTDETCEGGCASGRCDDDPCVGVTCDAPPADSCMDGASLRVHDVGGTCDEGECSYGSRVLDCPHGCEEGRCLPGACEGVTCDSPPSMCHEASGSCADGTCRYELRPPSARCDDGDPCTIDDRCGDGTCEGAPMRCDAPPAATCVDASTLETYEAVGSCSEGECVYESTRRACAHGCEGGTCLDDPCSDVSCDSPPSPSACYASTGTCAEGGCNYSFVDGACDDGDPCTVRDRCDSGACSGRPMRCDSPPADTCVDASTLRTYGDSGSCAEGSCDYTFTDQSCEHGCEDGACRTCETVTECDDGDACTEDLLVGGGCDSACVHRSIESCTAEPGTTISSDVELCGERVYDGDFEVVGGARVYCPDGHLTIRARNIFVDPASSIGVAPVSDRRSGEDSPMRRVNGIMVPHGAGGGGHGTPGSPGRTSNWLQPSGTCVSATGGSGGGVSGSATDLSVSYGTAGGHGCISVAGERGCTTEASGGLGGGVLRLIAEGEVSLDGKLRARGGAGEPMSGCRECTGIGYSGAGGGSGGSVVLLGRTVTVGPSGFIDVGGGSGGQVNDDPTVWQCHHGDTSGGAGGHGRVKIGYAESFTNEGVAGVEATRTVSVLPPVLASPSHPDPNVIYNDADIDFVIAWTSVPDAEGYLYALTDDPNFVLTPSNGTFTTELSASFPPSELGSRGRSYAHVAALDSDGVLTAAASTWVHLTNWVPLLESTSHPDPAAWYPNRSVILSWRQRSTWNGVAYYRVDRSSVAEPGRTEDGYTRAVDDDRVLITTDANGEPLGDGAYYVHVALEDTMGRLGSRVATYRVQLGSEPARTSFFGYVEDASGERLSGVRLRMEPYGLEATTNASGYFIFRNVYEGTYELRTTEAPFLEATVDTATSPFTLRP